MHTLMLSLPKTKTQIYHFVNKTGLLMGKNSNAKFQANSYSIMIALYGTDYIATK